MRFKLSAGLVALVASVVPQAAFAGIVCTAPLSKAPALAMPILALLAIGLALVAAFRLRVSPAKKGVLAGVLGLMFVFAAVYAGGTTYTVQDADCNKRVSFNFDPFTYSKLESMCPEPIEIVELHPDCDDVDTSGAVIEEEEAGLDECELGMILNNGDRCKLPRCRT